MKHARADYNRIQDPDGKIGADEPVFLLRAQDKSAPEAVRFWADRNAINGGSAELSYLAGNQAAAMEDWQTQHGSKPADVSDSQLAPTEPSVSVLASFVERISEALGFTEDDRTAASFHDDLLARISDLQTTEAQLLKIVRDHSGRDSFDDATEGFNVTEELTEHLDEMDAMVEREQEWRKSWTALQRTQAALACQVGEPLADLSEKGFEKWAFIHDFDLAPVQPSSRPGKFASEKTKGAWLLWGYLASALSPAWPSGDAPSSNAAAAAAS
jgi:hypothetical protein